MNQSIISVRYAKALMRAGADNQCLDVLKTDMDLISVAISENPKFKQLLDDPVVKPPQKRKVMADLLEKRVHSLTLNFVNLIIRNRREIILSDVARNFIDIYEKSKGIKRANVVSAVGMDEDTKQQLQKQLNALFKADVQISSDVDPKLIGGFFVRAGDQQYDASLASALDRMRKTLIIS